MCVQHKHRQRTLTEFQRFEMQISSANERLRIHHTISMPALLRELEQIEAARYSWTGWGGDGGGAAADEVGWWGLRSLMVCCFVRTSF
jgi:hypothetical protein